MSGGLLLAAAVGLTATAALPTPAMAQAGARARDPQAEAFVDTNARRVLAVLNDRRTSIERFAR